MSGKISPSNRVLQFFLASLFLILVRVWHLTVIQYDKHVELAEAPQKQTLTEKRERGTIRDRFNIPLATNRVQYNASIRYADIRQIPTFRRSKKGRRKPRREYIEELAAFLGQELDLSPQDIEDTIHGKASLFPHTPFVLKEDLSEELYSRLKMCEKDWLGLYMEKGSKRVYPQGKVGCHLVGYMGAISRREYQRVAAEIQQLKTFLASRSEGQAVVLPKGFTRIDEVAARLAELRQQSYTIHDQVGKAGVEASYDELLRGKSGKKLFAIDSQGNLLHTLPGSKEGESGNRLILSISSELQEEAEKLLTEYQGLQEERDKATGKERRTPWQRGGAIVAIDPRNGEVLALASYPRYDPNDLTPAHTEARRKEKCSSIYKWFESESHIGEIWDGKRPLERERYSEAKNLFYPEEQPLFWEEYLRQVLPTRSPIRESLDALATLEEAAHFKGCIEELLHLGGLDSVPALFTHLYERGESIDADLEEEIAPYLKPITHSRDKLLFVDLLYLASGRDSACLIDQTFEEHRLSTQTAAFYLDQIKEEARAQFHTGEFQAWRQEHFSKYLKAKRKEEQKQNHYARPYVEYLEKEEKNQFAAYWDENKARLLHTFVMDEHEDPLLARLNELLSPLSKEEQLRYLSSLRTFSDLTEPLLTKYPALRHHPAPQLEKHLAASFYPSTGFGYARSEGFRTASPMGSIFKLIPAYAGLRHQEEADADDLNPLVLTDDLQWTSRPGSMKQVLGYLESGEPIKRLYHGGVLPRGYPNQGKLNVVKAIERSSNIYFSILAGDLLKSPRTLVDTATSFGLGEKTGIDLPGEYKGSVPTDVLHNKTALYAFAIGQHSLVATPLQAAVLFSTLANGGKVVKPQIVKLSAGKEISFTSPEITREIPLSPPIQHILFKGMEEVVSGDRGFARSSVIRRNYHTPDAYQAYRRLRTSLMGKTGTAEILYKQTIDSESLAKLEKHVWFAGFQKPEQGEVPEIVIAVYFRFGTAGKQGAPIVARMIERWEEIKSLHKTPE